MDITSTQKYILISPKKVRLIANLIRRMSPQEAVEKLPFVNKRGAEFLIKVIKTALADAKNKGLSEENLFFKEIQILEGPRLKRGRPVSKGTWHPIIKKMCHIRVTLGVKEEKKKEKSGSVEKGVKKDENKGKIAKNKNIGKEINKKHGTKN